MNIDSQVAVLPARERCLLLAQWINTLASEKLGTKGYGNSGPTTWNFQKNEQQALQVEIDPDQLDCLVLSKADDIAGPDVDAVISEAVIRARRGDLGDAICYHTQLVSPPLDMFNRPIQFMRTLGAQVAIVGMRRLSDIALLEFGYTQPITEPQLLVPETQIDVCLFIPGGKPGPFSSHLAAHWMEFVRLVCSFALARPVEGSLGVIFPAKPEKEEHARAIRTDATILGLARKSVNLDPIAIHNIGDRVSLDRYRSALVAYEASMIQQNPDVSVVLLVSAIEAIVSPTESWRKERLVARFQKEVNQYSPDTLDEVLAHANFEQAFGGPPRGREPRRQRLDLLDRIYSLRSVPVHSGPSMFAGGMMSMGDDPGQMRVALIADLAESVMLRFLEAPRSSLIGHPTIWPPGGSQEAPGASTGDLATTSKEVADPEASEEVADPEAPAANGPKPE